MGKVLKFFHLSGQEKTIFCRAVYLLFSYRIALSRTSFHSLIESSASPGRESSLYTPASIPVDTLVRLFIAACRIVPFSTCLSRAMAGKRFLTAYGYLPRIHIGVAREKKEELEAHAWLSLDGHIILGDVPDLDRYRELPLLQGGETRES